jgi:hypothetical protein
MFFSKKNHPLSDALETVALAQRSPAVEGVIEGAKAATISAPIFATIQALRNRSATAGAIAGGIGAGVLFGLAAAAKQGYYNTRSEAYIKYHLENIRKREQEAADPQSPQDGFHGGFHRVYYPY